MALNFKISTAERDAMCNALVDLIDTGTGAGRIEIREGSPPTNVADTSSGTLLATLTFSATAFGASLVGTATADTITPDTNAAATGTAGYFRVYKGAGTDTQALFQGTCGLSGCDMNFDSVSVITGGTVACAVFTITVPVS